MKKALVTFGVVLGSLGLIPFSAGAMMCGKQVATKTQVNALTASEAKTCSKGFSSTQIGWLSVKQIVTFDAFHMIDLSAAATSGWTTMQIQQMSAVQLKGLIDSKELTAAQSKTVTARYQKLTKVKTSPSTTVKKSPSTKVKTSPSTTVKKSPSTTVKSGY